MFCIWYQTLSMSYDEILGFISVGSAVSMACMSLFCMFVCVCVRALTYLHSQHPSSKLFCNVSWYRREEHNRKGCWFDSQTLPYPTAYSYHTVYRNLTVPNQTNVCAPMIMSQWTIETSFYAQCSLFNYCLCHGHFNQSPHFPSFLSPLSLLPPLLGPYLLLRV